MPSAPAVIICANAGHSNFADDMPAMCSDCGTAIVHRPHAASFPIKVCMDCGFKRMWPRTACAITPETDREVLLLLAKGGRA